MVFCDSCPSELRQPPHEVAGTAGLLSKCEFSRMEGPGRRGWFCLHPEGELASGSDTAKLSKSGSLET